MEWFYSGLGGIYQADNSVAYDHIIIAPKPVGNINRVKCSYISSKGLISSEWEIKEKAFVIHFTVPVNARAKIIIPEEYVKEKCVVRDVINNKIVRVNITRGEFEITSGTYTAIAN
jgi:hypothetical protein